MLARHLMRPNKITRPSRELLTVIYAIKKFRPYLLFSKVIIYADHSALKHLLDKADFKP